MTRSKYNAKPRRKNPEQALQIDVAKFLGHALRPPTIWTAFPAGGGGKVRGTFLKAMGLKPGWPDLLVIHKFTLIDDFALLLGIELKAGNGRQTAEQKAVMQSFRDMGMGYEVCRSLNDVHLALAHHMIPMHARLS